MIETDQGLVLVDTGLGLDDYANPTAMTRIFRVIMDMPFDSAEAAINQVQRLGYSYEDVKHIILTHMHFDHCSGLADFPHAAVHVHRREYDAFTDNRILHWNEFAYDTRYIAHSPDFVLYDQVDSKWFDFDAIRLPFEPKMYLIPLHGHSLGHCGVAIDTESDWFFHAGDAGAIYNDQTPAWLIWLVLGPYDQRLRKFLREHPEVEIVNSHMYPEYFT